MPSDIVSTDYKVPEEKRVDLGPMTERHRKIIRFHYDNKHKEILLRPLNYIDMEIVNAKINGQYPEYPKWCTEAEQLWKVQLKGQGLPPEGMERLQQLSKLMLPFRHEFSIRCFVDPKLETVEELSNLLFDIGPDASAELVDMLMLLASRAPAKEVSSAFLLLANRFGIAFPDDLNMENATAVQVLTMQKAVNDEAMAIQKATNG